MNKGWSFGSVVEHDVLVNVIKYELHCISLVFYSNLLLSSIKFCTARNISPLTLSLHTKDNLLIIFQYCRSLISFL